MDTSASSSSSSSSTGEDINNSSNGGSSRTVIVGAVVGGVVAFGVLAATGYWIFCSGTVIHGVRKNDITKKNHTKNDDDDDDNNNNVARNMTRAEHVDLDIIAPPPCKPIRLPP
jgi:hypothetical protein